MPACCAADTLKQGMTLVANDVLNAKNGAQRLVMQADGNLVMYSAKNKVLWKTDTMQAGNRVTMQADGNLVVYGKDSTCWNSLTCLCLGSLPSATDTTV